MLGRLIRAFLTLFFRVEIRDRDNNFAAAGDSVLIVINVGSLLDPVLIGTMLKERVTIVIDRNMARKWWMYHILALTDTIEVDFSSKTSTLDVVRAIKTRRRCMVFHESMFQNDQRYMRVLEATALIAEKAGATLLPIRVDGASRSRFSYARHKVRLQYFPKITMTVLPPQKLDTGKATATPRDRRRHAAVQLFKVMSELLYGSTSLDANIVQQVNECCAIFGRSYIIAEDQERTRLSYGNLLTKANVLGRAMRRVFAGEERVGFMLPSALAGVVAFIAIHVAGKVPAMINFSSGAAPIVSGCRTVGLKSILTARKFIEAGELGQLEQALIAGGLRMVYMEDIADKLRTGEKLRGALAALFRRAPKTPASDTLAILFTSGTEGSPKAVFMSHRNANANQGQLRSIISFTPGDRFFSCLPMFHTFGLGVGVLLPLYTGMRMILYPSPLHYRIVPQLFYETLATVICGTDTFFTGYARYGRPYDFFNARLVISGGEKMRETTARIWQEKYNVTMLQGYGATETSPVIGVSTPANNRRGSIGRILPGLRHKIKPMPGMPVEEGGDLWVKGDNVMLGYMRATNPGVLEPPRDPDIADPGEALGWYGTGDIVRMDDEDFIFIKGRAKRFAKVGGEMVSLAAVESALSEIWPNVVLGVVAVPDSRKGEQLVLIIEQEQVTASRIASSFASRGLSPLWTPRRILSVKQAPLLGSGKFDYPRAQEMAMELVG